MSFVLECSETKSSCICWSGKGLLEKDQLLWYLSVLAAFFLGNCSWWVLVTHYLPRFRITVWFRARVWKERKCMCPVCVVLHWDCWRKIKTFKQFHYWLLFCLGHACISSCATRLIPGAMVSFLESDKAQSPLWVELQESFESKMWNFNSTVKSFINLATAVCSSISVHWHIVFVLFLYVYFFSFFFWFMNFHSSALLWIFLNMAMLQMLSPC